MFYNNYFRVLYQIYFQLLYGISPMINILSFIMKNKNNPSLKTLLLYLIRIHNDKEFETILLF